MTRCQRSMSIHAVDEHGHTLDGERRASGERRRNTSGLFEIRARRDGIGGDRRQTGQEAASAGSRLRALWRRVRP